MECYSSAGVVLEDGERFVCRAGSSYSKSLFFFPCLCRKSRQGFHSSHRGFLVAEYFVSLSLL